MPRKKIKKSLVKVQISISIPKTIVDRIDKLAENTNRNRSNFIANALEKSLGDEE